MIRSLYSALNGIRSSIRRHEVSANNIANMNTRGYKSKRVLQSEQVDNGGTSTAVTDNHPSLNELSVNRSSIAMNPEIAEISDVNIAQEMTDQILALRSLEANILLFRSGNEMSEDLINLK